MRRVINWKPARGARLLLGLLPFTLLIAVYLAGSSIRLAENPADKLLPSPASLAAATWQMAATEDARTGRVLLWQDTGASLRRLGLGLGIATVIGLVLGIAIGLIPYVRAGLAPLVAVLSMIPPMAILPILFIVLGLEELSKVALIALGIAPFLVRDLALRVQSLPEELLIKAQTLGACTWRIVLRVVLPQALPRLIAGVRLSLGAAWLFLIAAEAIAATEGLGYRIFLMRRYLAMDIILPYVAWITLLAFASDVALRWLTRRGFAWSDESAGS
jgi:NitT/TauT family transport system permease protein